MCIFQPFIDYCLIVSNIKHSMLDFSKENNALLRNKYQVILPETMLEYLAIHNSFFSVVYMEDIPDMNCQLYHLHLEIYVIQQKNYQNSQYLCYNYCVSTSVDI